MANELEISYQGVASLYAVIRRHDDAYVWSVTRTTLETWADSTLDDYDIVMTDSGGDVYHANWPPTMTAGQYRVLYYRRDGALPGTSDLLLATNDIYWDGQTTTSQSTVNLDPNALTSLESIKRFLRLTQSGDDTLLVELINQTTDRIERICGRQFKQRTYRQRYHDASRTGLVLEHFPVAQIHRVSIGATAAMTAIYSGSAIRADVRVNESAVILRSISAAGTVSTHTLDFETYPTMSTLVAAVDTQVDWSATLTRDAPSADLHFSTAADARGRTVWLSYPQEEDAACHLDFATGTLHLSGPWAVGPVLVEYEAGFLVIPDDVVLVANELVAQAYHLGRRDTSVDREKIGDYSYALSGLASLSDAQLVRLRPYMNIPLGGI